MIRLAAVLAFLFSATVILFAYTDPQKAEPNPQAPPAPQASTEHATPPGSANGSAANSNLTQTNSADDAALQGRIQDALRNEPDLAASHISVNVTDTAIEISGTVPSSREKQTAERIAESFDGNRKFDDKLLVTGQAPPAASSGNTGTKTGASNPR